MTCTSLHLKCVPSSEAVVAGNRKKSYGTKLGEYGFSSSDGAIFMPIITFVVQCFHDMFVFMVKILTLP
jgi:hypothetical protein